MTISPYGWADGANGTPLSAANLEAFGEHVADQVEAIAATATGPGGVAGGNSGTAFTISAPAATGQTFYVRVNAATTVTFPTPTAGSWFFLDIQQDNTGHAVSIASNPAVNDPSGVLNVQPITLIATGINQTANSLTQMLCKCNDIAVGWEVTVFSPGAPTADQADQARQSLGVAVTRVQAVLTGNQSSLTGLPLVGSYQTVDGDKILLPDQTTGSQNGLYAVHAGAWLRTSDYPTGGVPAVRLVQDANTGSIYELATTGAVTVDTTATVWTLVVNPATAALTQAGTVTPNVRNGRWQTLTVTTNAAITIAAPAGPPSSAWTADLSIEVSNTSGGAMGTITWNAAFVFAGNTWTNPANAKKRVAHFRWNGASWVCQSISSADY